MAAPTPPDDLHAALTGHLAWLRGLAGHLVRDPHEADDLVQDTVVAALRRPPELDRPLRPWLSGVLRRLHLERRRKGARRERREGAVARVDATPGTDELVERLELGQRLIAAVRELPEPYRTTVALRYREGLEPVDIARRLGVPGGTVRWRLREGLARIRARLDGEHGSRGAWVALLAPLAELPPPPPVSPLWSTAWGVPSAVAGAALLATVVAVWSVGERARTPDAVATPAAAVDRSPPAADPLGGRTETADAPRRAPLVVAGRADTWAPPPPARTDTVEAHTVEAPTVKAGAVEAGATGTLAGRVLLPGGDPAAGVEVIAVPAEPYALAAESPSLGGRPSLARTETDGRGAFELTGLPEELLQLVASDGREQRCISAPVRVRAQVRNPLVLRLGAPDAPAFDAEPDAPQAWLERRCSGRVRWSGPEPPPPLRIRVRRAFGPSTVALASGFRVLWRAPDAPAVPVEDDGRFTLPARFEAGEGRIGLEVLLDDGRSLGIHPVDARRLGSVLEVPAGPTAALTVEVVPDRFETVPPRFVALSAGDGSLHAAPLLASDPPRFEGLAAGAYELRWFRDDPARESVAFHGTVAFLDVEAGERPAFELAPGEDRRARLDRRTLPLLQAGLSIDGESSARWDLEILPPRSSNGTPDLPLRLAALDATGMLHVRLDRAGPHTLRIRPSNGQEAPLYQREVAVSADGAQVDVVLRTGAVSGTWTADPTAESLWLRTALPDGARWVAAFEPLGGSDFRVERAALGGAEVVHAPTAAQALERPALAALQVPAGGLAGLVLP